MCSSLRRWIVALVDSRLHPVYEYAVSCFVCGGRHGGDGAVSDAAVCRQISDWSVSSRHAIRSRDFRHPITILRRRGFASVSSRIGCVFVLSRRFISLNSKQGLNCGGSRRISDPAPLIWDPLPLMTDPVPHNWDPAPFCWDPPLCWVESKHQTLFKCGKSQT